jgi:flagellar biosynthesis/type III secretory pathway protein FliH
MATSEQLKKEADAYRDGFRAGYKEGFDDGKAVGYTDAKHRAWLALEGISAADIAPSSRR